ncbi:MAG TPA: hypothetical protein VN665_02330, partial [Candidatus Paceibacterota bacterium]|nr:hypothetical protein [Candidatus Paceibacterota bacterium]
GKLTQFAKDNSHVFYFEEGDAYGGLLIQTILGADPATFEILNDELFNISAKDKNHSYGCLEEYDGCNVGIVQ